MRRKSFFPAIFLNFLSAAFLLFPAAVSAQQKYDEKSIECSSTLFGTVSKDDCEKICNPPGRPKQTEYACFESPTAKGCYTCARDQYCSDLGFITSWDCAICDANPATECVSAGMTLPFGGTIGGKTWSGVQCYKCVAKPDRCNQAWPGSSWLAACQANCAAPDACVLVGIHQGNACFKCQKAPKDCKAMGFLNNAQCGPCNANPQTQCIWAGFAQNGENCFQCVAKNVPPPPPPKTCRDHGLFDNCNPCLRDGKGCNQIAINPNLLCAQCTDPGTTKRCQPPSLNADECQGCIERGGQCMPMTQVRGDPPCFRCYIPPAPKTGCAKYALFNGCSPNPCSGSEECQIVQPEPNLSCGTCVYKEGPEDTTCTSRRMYDDCSWCFRNQMACRNVFVPEANRYCHRCYWPDDQCKDGELPGGCTESSCSTGQTCFDMDNGCHRCEAAGSCSDKGFISCAKDCKTCEQDSTKICQQAGFNKSEGACCECVPRSVRDDCPQGSLGGSCPGSCNSQQECKNVGYHCHSCLNKDDKCEKYGALSTCWPNDPCDPETQVCDSMSPQPKPGLYCYACKSKADWCKQYGNYFPSCNPNPCKPGERCEMTGVTMSSVNCAKCISPEDDEKMCEEYGYVDGNCTSSSCSTGLQCRETTIYSNKCHKCECENGTNTGGCAPDSCGEGQSGKCVETVPGKCHRCDSEGTCNDNNLDNYDQCKDSCEGSGQYKCEPTGITKSDGPCYRCAPRTTLDCQEVENSFPGTCPGSCSSQQECRPVGNWCHVCLNKDDTCEKYGAITSCWPTSPCNPETEVCDSLNPSPKPGLYCNTCKPKADWCKQYGNYFPSCSPNPCKENERCVMTGVTMSSVECAKCISKTEDDEMCERFQMADGLCTSNSCSNGFDCRDEVIYGVKCHKCECAHGSYEGGCAADKCQGTEPPEKCIETVPGKCHRCDSAGTCQENGLLRCGHECRESCEGYGQYKCVPAGVTKSDGECCDCAPRSTLDCPDGSLAGNCPAGCHSDQVCVDFPGKCHKCVPKTESCPQGTINAPCSPGICGSDQKCLPAGEICHTCQAKECLDYGHLNTCVLCDVDNLPCDELQPREGLTCYECGENHCSPNLKKEQCAECERQGGVCTPITKGTVERGKECYKCEPKPQQPPECEHGTTAGACTQSSCSSQEECVNDGEKCHRCQPKKESCEDRGLSDGDTCARTCKDGTCLQGKADDYGTYCWECKKTSTQPQCDQGFEPGGCPASCSSEQECIPSGNCHMCKKKGKRCPELGLMYHHDCRAMKCSENGGTCVQKQMDEYTNSCWECQKAPSCPSGYEPGGCYGYNILKCGLGEFCHNKDGCHKCVPMDTGPCVGQGFPGSCPGYCSANDECVPSGEECHMCRKKPTAHDGGGGETGGGTGVIGGGYGGYGTGAGYDWKDKYKTGLGLDYDYGGTGVIGGGETTTQKKNCIDYGMLPYCLECTLAGKDCQTVTPEEGLTCKQCVPRRCGRDMTWEECEECEWDGGYCVPAEVTTEARLYGTSDCYRCVNDPQCEDYGTFCSCSACPRGTACVPAGELETGKMCYHCVRAVTTDGIFIVIVLEDPLPRSVLAGAGAPGFSPSSILGLMKVDTSKLEQIKQLAQLAKMGKISSFGSVQEVTSALSGLAKQKSFNKDCFKDLEEAPLPQEPPPSAGEKGSAPKFGSDEKDSAMVNGPIVACGKENGVDVLNVFDASGTKIKSILKDEFAKNPNVLTDALLKADELSSKLMALKDIDPKQWLKQAAQKAVSTLAEKLFAPRKSEDARDKKANAIDPNDPLYYKDPGKKKSLVDERLKKAASSIFDVGANAIGMNSSGGMNVGKQALDVDDQWGIRKIGYLPKSEPDSAWNVVGGEEKNIVVAVVDSGLDMTHPDGPAHIWTNAGEVPGNGIDDDGNGFIDDVNGWNFLNDNNELTDHMGHGTFVAGIIAAKRNNGIGIAGINPGAVILPIKVADGEGNTNSLNIYRAIHYAIKQGARVINISLGARGVSEMEETAVRYARAHGIFVAIAAGNVGENIGDHGPASAAGGFAVGAMDFDGQKSTISNWGANNGLIAPGEMIYSLRSIDSFNPKKSSKDSKFYYAQSGTSFSTPMVAATASLLLARDPQLTATEIEDILQAAADDIYAQGWDGESGAGVLNATNTLKYAQDKFVTVKLTELRVNKNNKGDIESVDVYGTVRGNFDSFTVGMGKGKRADSFKEVAGPYTMAADNAWITRIPEKLLRGSDEWIIQVEAKDKSGKPKAAQSFVTLQKPKHINDY